MLYFPEILLCRCIQDSFITEIAVAICAVIHYSDVCAIILCLRCCFVELVVRREVLQMTL